MRMNEISNLNMIMINPGESTDAQLWQESKYLTRYSRWDQGVSSEKSVHMHDNFYWLQITNLVINRSSQMNGKMFHRVLEVFCNIPKVEI